MSVDGDRSNGGASPSRHDAAAGEARSFLFLQGPSSPLFQWIADELERRGHGVHRINVCAGDRVFWRRKGAANYRGTLDDWPGYLAAFLAGHGITEIILLGEERPHHRAAVALAAENGLPVYAIEMGYLRPDWISIEHGGSGCNSHFPNNPQHILKEADGLEDPEFTVLYRQSFAVEAAMDLAYNLPNVFFGFLHPHYRSHALDHPLAEYAGWARRLLRGRARRRQSEQAMELLAQRDGDYFVYPLQLQTDYQIRVHSPFRSQEEAIDLVLASFASHAAPTDHLIVKTHPLDPDLRDWPAHVHAGARKFDVVGRVHVVHTADLGELFASSRGAVMINSSAGIQAIIAGKPVKVLGSAIYDMAGLSHQGSLDDFWTNPDPVQPDLRSAFLRLIAVALHERGNFYSRAGARAGAEAIAKRIHDGRVNQPGGYVPSPPRPRPAKS